MLKSNIFLIYLGWIVSGILVLLCQFFKITPLILAFLVMFLVLWPGFGISRLTKLKLGEDTLSQIVTWLMFGLVMILGLNCLTLLFGWTMNALVTIIFSLSLILFIGAFILDFQRQTFKQADFHWRSLMPDIWTTLILILSFLMLTVIAFKGSIIKGGAPLFHIAMMLKAISKEPLTLHNIAYQPDVINIAYLFPIWHIFLGICAKISHLDIFTLWQRIILPLSIMSILVWSWLARQILPSRQVQALGILFFLIFSFTWDDGYVFTALAIPNIFSQLILLPLAVGSTLYYIFLPTNNDNRSKQAIWPWLITLIPFSVVLALVHPQGYFYYFFIIGSLLIFWLVLRFKEPNYKIVLSRIAMALGSSVIAFLPILIVWQFLGQHTLTNTFAALWNNPKPEQVRFIKITTWSLSMKYAFVMLPLILLFIKKQRQLLLILATAVMIPIVSMEFLRPLILKTVSYLWLRRLPANVFWHFLILALIIGFLFLVFDRIISKLNHTYQKIISILLGIFFGVMILVQLKFGWVEKSYNLIMGSDANHWMNRYYLWGIIALLIIVIITMILRRFYPKLANYFQLEKARNPFIYVFLTLMVSFLLLAPSYQALAQAPISRLIKPIKKNQNQVYIEYYVGGRTVIDFIEKNMSPSAVFDCYQCYFYLLPVVNVKMPVYGDNADDLYLGIYNIKLPIKDRIKIIDQAKMEYLLISVDPKKINRLTNDFDAFPQYFTKIFTKKPMPKERNAVIYKVNREQIKRDLAQ